MAPARGRHRPIVLRAEAAISATEGVVLSTKGAIRPRDGATLRWAGIVLPAECIILPAAGCLLPWEGTLFRAAGTRRGTLDRLVADGATLFVFLGGTDERGAPVSQSFRCKAQ
jgi:hypothetical protein